ncbi:MAG: hypothetical protein ACREPX_10295 [Rhodanobacteraceae bacterium]
MNFDLVRHGAASALMLCALVATPAHAQWSSDPANNLIVADIVNGNTQPKIVAAADGGFYVSWLDNIGAGFDILLQKLDATGNEVWAHNGVVVAERDYSSTYDYGLSTDSLGNAYVSFNCCAGGAPDEHLAVSKIASDGSLQWGSAGIAVSTVAEAVYNAYVTPTGDGNVVVAWSCDGGVRAQKLDATGASLWAVGGVLVDQPAGLKLLGGVQPAGTGDAIISWSNQAASAHILRAQKLASLDGAQLWGGGTAVRVFGTGNLQFGYYPPFLTDGAGGGVFWDYDAVGVSFTARVQHIDSGGNLLLGTDGVVATTDATADHTDTSATYDAVTGDIYVVWRNNFTTGGGQTFDGVSAQRVDSTGARAWGDSGIVLVPPTDATDGTHSISQLIALPVAGGFIASWVTGAIPAADQPLTAARLDVDGNYVWPSQTVGIKTTRYTGRAEGAVGSNGMGVYAWQDGDDGAGTSTIRAQNVNPDGSLGNSGATHTIGGSVSGLEGQGLILQLNGGADLAILGDGAFMFPTPLNDGSTYLVSVLSQPSGPDQICLVANDSGTVSGADVTDVEVTCTAKVPDFIFSDGFDGP